MTSPATPPADNEVIAVVTILNDATAPGLLVIKADASMEVTNNVDQATQLRVLGAFFEVRDVPDEDTDPDEGAAAPEDTTRWEWEEDGLVTAVQVDVPTIIKTDVYKAWYLDTHPDATEIPDPKTHGQLVAQFLAASSPEGDENRS